MDPISPQHVPDQLVRIVPSAEVVVDHARQYSAQLSTADLVYIITRHLFDPAFAPPHPYANPTPETFDAFLEFVKRALMSGDEMVRAAVAPVVEWFAWDSECRATFASRMSRELREQVESTLDRDEGLLRQFVPFAWTVMDRIPDTRGVIEHVHELYEGSISPTSVLDALSNWAIALHHRVDASNARKRDEQALALWLELTEEAMTDNCLRSLLTQTYIEDIAYEDPTKGFVERVGPIVRAAVDEWRRGGARDAD